jgi:hypothetical protein
MSQCITIGGHCCCAKPHAIYCEQCHMYICRIFFVGHTHMTREERELDIARRTLLAKLYRRIYQLRQETTK